MGYWFILDTLTSYWLSELEVESLRICAELVRRLVGEGLDWRLEYVLARMIHSVGDPLIVKLVRYSEGILEAFKAAENSLKRVVTDVEMVAAGVRGRCLRMGLGLEVAVRYGARGGEGVVARGAEELLRRGLVDKGSLVVNGSSPSFLEVILRGVEEGLAKPLAIIATPPGFIKAPKAKEELLRLEGVVPFIAVMGSRGGSPVAAAAANAFLDIASGKALDIWGRVKDVIHS